jgi:hypothetical protein
MIISGFYNNAVRFSTGLKPVKIKTVGAGGHAGFPYLICILYVAKKPARMVDNAGRRLFH